MNIIVQVNIYRRIHDEIEFLLLKRTDASGGFWQPVTARVRPGKTVHDTLKHAITAEAGIKKFIDLSTEIYTYEWYEKGKNGRDVMVAAEVAPESAITLDPAKHQAYEWVPYDQAIKRVTWHGNKEYIERLHLRVLSQRALDAAAPASSEATAGPAAPADDSLPKIHDVHITPQ